MRIEFIGPRHIRFALKRTLQLFVGLPAGHITLHFARCVDREIRTVSVLAGNAGGRSTFLRVLADSIVIFFEEAGHIQS
jgi:hypothetical protein